MLDTKRLGKQRVETYQILRALAGDSKGWLNHPAVKMWRGHERSLARYGLAVCEEWVARGYQDTCYDKITDLLERADEATDTAPEWLGNPELHLSHQSNLLRKDEIYYSQYFAVSPALPYYWPTNA